MIAARRRAGWALILVGDLLTAACYGLANRVAGVDLWAAALDELRRPADYERRQW